MALEHVSRFDLSAGEVSEHRETQAGGLVAKAKLTRVGVFDYRMPDGSTRRELRHPDEVFHPDSLATFPGATVTIDHPGRVHPGNWKEHTVGHVQNAKRDGAYVAGEIHIQDGPAIEKTRTGKAKELSCGYGCDIDPTPGTYDGQDFDVAQRNIRINHVGMGPAGWGRMGPDVRLHLDSGCAVSGLADDHRYVSGMTEAEKAALDKATKDAADAKVSLDAANKLVQDAKTAADKATADAVKDRAELVELRATNALLVLQAKTHNEDAAAKKTAAEVEKIVQDTIAVRSVATKVFGADWKHDGKDVASIKREVIGAQERGYDMALVQDGGALDAVFAMVTKRVTEVGAARQDLNDALRKPKLSEQQNDDGDPVAAATAGLLKKQKEACKPADRRDRRRRDARAMKGAE